DGTGEGRHFKLAVPHRCVVRYHRRMATVFFITHPDVLIDPAVPVPDWPLSPRGVARMRAMLAQPWISGIVAVWTSTERKAGDGAAILAAHLGVVPIAWTD